MIPLAEAERKEGERGKLEAGDTGCCGQGRNGPVEEEKSEGGVTDGSEHQGFLGAICTGPQTPRSRREGRRGMSLQSLRATPSGSQICSQIRQKWWVTLGTVIWDWHLKQWGQFCRTEPLPHGTWKCLQGDGVRILHKMQMARNGRTPNRCHRGSL